MKKINQRFFGRLVSGLLFCSTLLTFGFGNTLEAIAGQPSVKISRAALMKQGFESIQNPANVMWLTATTKAPADDVRKINADVLAKWGNSPFPALSLLDNEITMNGKKTGVWVDPTGPLRIRYHGRTWKLDKSDSVEKNYYSLAKFLGSSQKQTSLLDWLIPSAEAKVDGKTVAEFAGAAGGAAVSGVAALLAATILALGGPEIIVGLLGLVVLSLLVNVGIGVMVGDHLYDKKKITAELKNLLGATNIVVSCDSHEALLKAKLPDGRALTMEFSQSEEQPKGDHEYARIFDETDGHVVNVASLNQKNSFYQKMLQCKDNAGAQKIASQLKDAVVKLNEAEATEDGSRHFKDPGAPDSPGTPGEEKQVSPAT
jgi:hypothetical protein